MHKNIIALFFVCIFQQNYCSTNPDNIEIANTPLSSPFLLTLYQAGITPKDIQLHVCNSGGLAVRLVLFNKDKQTNQFDKMMHHFVNTSFYLVKKDNYYSLNVNGQPIAHIDEKHINSTIERVSLSYLFNGQQFKDYNGSVGNGNLPDEKENSGFLCQLASCTNIYDVTEIPLPRNSTNRTRLAPAPEGQNINIQNCKNSNLLSCIKARGTFVPYTALEEDVTDEQRIASLTDWRKNQELLEQQQKRSKNESTNKNYSWHKYISAGLFASIIIFALIDRCCHLGYVFNT